MRIAFELAEAGRIVVGVYNSAGRQVDLLADQRLPAGHHVALWDGTDLAGTPVASGVYQIVLRTDAGTFVRKATLVR
jgi:flagellar hook assembly protein FlgD